MNTQIAYLLQNGTIGTVEHTGEARLGAMLQSLKAAGIDTSHVAHADLLTNEPARLDWREYNCYPCRVSYAWAAAHPDIAFDAYERAGLEMDSPLVDVEPPA